MTDDEAGKIAYDAYWESFDDIEGVCKRSIPWDNLGEESKRMWRAGGEAVVNAYKKHARRGVTHYRKANWYMNSCGLGSAANATSKSENVTCKSCLADIQRHSQ